MKRYLFWKVTAIVVLLLSTNHSYADYFINFEGEGEVKTSYASGTVNLSGLDWNMTDVLIGDLDNDWKNGTKSARLRGYGSSVMSMLEDKEGGVGTISFYYRRYGTDAQVDWKVEYSSDGGASWIQVGDVFTSPASEEVQLFEEAINVEGAVRIRIKRETESGTANRRLNIDDITLTDFTGSGNLPPVISNIVQTPDSEITSSTTVSVSADISDPDGTISLAQLKWGTSAGNYPNIIPMAVSQAPTYTTSSNIPAQSSGTTIHYVIYAEDNEGGNRTSPAKSYQVKDPATTDLPYQESFDEGFGDIYTFSVSGDSKTWLHSNGGYAYMNGHNTGDLEDDWLILPGVNISYYSNVTLSFDLLKQYGYEDDNNYLKLLYSTNYTGIGNPLTASWNELPFSMPVDEQNWENSGDVDIDFIQGEQVYIALRYHYDVGAYRLWQVDNISINGEVISADLPVKLAITDINNGNTPSVGNAFSISVQAQDADSNPANVNTNTSIQLSVASGTGTLGGTLTKTLSEDQHTVVFDNLTYSIAQNNVVIKATAISGMNLESANSEPFNVLAVATKLAFADFPASGVIDLPIDAFEVQAQRPDGTVDGNFNGVVTLSKASGSGNLSGTLTKSFNNGIAIFDDISFDAAGSYSLKAQSTGLTDATSSTILISAPPEIISEIVPQYIQGVNGTNNSRLPVAIWVKIGNLQPNASYRYINQVVVESDSPTTNGAGNIIYTHPDGDFYRTTSPNLGTEGAYGNFTANAQGEYGGWFISEPTANVRFTPGNEVFFRIRLNDGNEGTTAMYWLTTNTAAQVINFGTEPDDAQGTAIRATSFATPKNFIFLFDNVNGSGRPLYITSIEATGIDYNATSTWANFYRTEVSGNDGAWGGIVPNVNAAGITRIEERGFTDNSIVETMTEANGVWGITDTRNPSGGIDDVLVLTLDVTEDPILITSPTTINGFYYVEGEGPSQVLTYTINGQNLLGAGNISIAAPTDYEISSNGSSFGNSLNLPFANGIISGQPLTISVRLKAGLEQGTYNGQQIVHNGGGAPEKIVTLNGEVTTALFPEILSEIVPQFVQGINGTNSNRIPMAFWLKIGNLEPNKTYRYINQIVVSDDDPNTNGAGNIIFLDEEGNYYRTTSPNLGTEGAYGQFNTNSQGEYSGWFLNETTGNARFTPGNQLYYRLRINDGNNGTEPVHRITTETTSTVINFGTSSSPNEGTAIRASSDDLSGSLVMLFDSSSSQARPIYATSVETTGIDFGSISSYANFYNDHVYNIDGAWGGILPNNLANGIRVIKVIHPASEHERTYQSSDGVWGLADTRNPSGGLNEVIHIDLTIIGLAEKELENLSIKLINNNFFIQNQRDEAISLEIFNTLGQIIFTEYIAAGATQKISHQLTTGIYVVRLHNTVKQLTTKFFIP